MTARLAHWLRLTGLLPPDAREPAGCPTETADGNGPGSVGAWADGRSDRRRKPLHIEDDSPWQQKALRDWEDSEA